MIERFEAAWRPFAEAVERLGDHGLEQTTGAGWTAKEMAAHAAFWLETVRPVLLGMFRGELEGWEAHEFGSGHVARDGWPGEDEHNAREAAWARDRPAAEVVARLHTAAADAGGVLATVTAAEAGGHDDWLEGIAGHLDHHRVELLDLLGDDHTLDSGGNRD